MQRFDHIGLVVRNLYEGAARLRDETGLDSYESGWFPGLGLGQRVVPLGGRHYLEIMSPIDRDISLKHFYSKWYEAALDDAGREDRFLGLVNTVDTMEEYQAIADRIGPFVESGLSVPGTSGESGDELSWTRILPDGRPATAGTYTLPDDRHHTWPRGLPNFKFWPEEANNHPDTIPEASTVNHQTQPRGISWVELGDEALHREWLGPGADDMDIRYVDKPAGLYAFGVATDDGEIVIRRSPIPLSLSIHYTP